MSKKVLVVGASGYIASRLIPALLADGHEVRCLARTPKKLARRDWIDQVEVARADVTVESSLPAALDGMEVVYYLVHSMSAGNEYHHLDMLSARNLSNAAAKAGVQKIIYLGGLADRDDEKLSCHLYSRIQTGDALRESGVPVIEFRSGVIIGTGSASFEMIRALADQFPVMIGPLWLKHRTQPVSTRDVVDRLVEAIDVVNGVSLTVDLGSEEIFTYIDIMLEYARSRRAKRLHFLLPFIPPRLMAFMISILTPVSYQYALPLVQGLKDDSLVQFPIPSEHFPRHHSHPYHRSLEIAWEETTLDLVDKTWLESGEVEEIGLYSGLAVHYKILPGVETIQISTAAVDWVKRYLGKGWGKVVEAQPREDEFTSEYFHPVFGRLWLRVERRSAGNGRIIERTVALRPEGLAGYLLFYFYRLFKRL